ncbi:hypothetical protein DLJ49_17750 [Rhodovulum sp. 12E13]|uniref:hypothetical protein n=1 Tax=Rhodovulum sp. 12E13 TaxID=2203891 RepID=UPI000E142FE9|nr:hypothetical protein [Rhodovulum sp. 12E13]RDC69854.1 hypothetical protein DLJ49_17750 [Rhodovulum sp. 12E13]
MVDDLTGLDATNGSVLPAFIGTVPGGTVPFTWFRLGADRGDAGSPQRLAPRQGRNRSRKGILSRGCATGFATGFATGLREQPRPWTR